MHVQSYIFDSPPRDISSRPLKITAKRYTFQNSAQEVHGLTLLITHCIGAHKEQWEPIIERLFILQQHRDRTQRIREAWSFDWQNHGDAAVLNQDILKDRPEGVSVFEWYPAITQFVRSPMMKGHRIVPMGHSAGAATVYVSVPSLTFTNDFMLTYLLHASMLTTRDIPIYELPYAAMILIEPTIVTRELFELQREDRMASMDFAVAATSSRRDHWPSKEKALEYFSKRLPWSIWDPRVLRLLVTYGLQDSPQGGVTLKCHRKQEAISYPDAEPHFEGAVQLSRICHALPVHIIWGTRNDLVPEFIQDSLSDVSQGCIVASVVKIKRAGHMVVQEQPDRLAHVISDMLNAIGSESSVERSKL
ncbi:hypothetical protein CVT24_002345 [Panaeolus cyanescens]|uniref:AB hydrolase-1 domain-containing protein n=1 Tax=Panaeolus cyanescens TaxID=181874 RepID=A0A409W172_9AGAR|nr:hypothetical protein CVT24_002345 [Panaeolus cyanescens]